MSRRAASLIAVAATVMAGLAVPIVSGAGPAAADTPSGPPPIAQRSAQGVTADALPTVQIDGVVWSLAVVGNTVYAGGSFANARPAGAAPGTSLTPRNNLLSYNLSTGVLNSSFAPSLNAQAEVVTASPDGSRIYVGGSFTTADGVQHDRIAAYSTATGQLISSFAPNLDATVNAIAATNTTVYVGGNFSTANGVARSHLAAFSAADGSLLGWAPTADDSVKTMALTPDGSRVIVGGVFLNINGSPAAGLGALDATSGTLLPWAATNLIKEGGSASGVSGLYTDGTAMYGTTWAFGSPITTLSGMFSADPDSGNLNWIEDCWGDEYGVFAVNGAAYQVGHSHNCSTVNGFPETNPRTTQRSIAYTAQATGTLGHDIGNPDSHSTDFFGQPAPSIINWWPNLDEGTFTGQNQGPWSISGNSQYVVEGGEFLHVNGVAQQGLVRFANPSIAPHLQGPMVTGSQFMPSLVSLTPGTVRVAIQTNWDRDDKTLHYQVFRNGNLTNPVWTATADSEFWNRPTIGFTDTGLTPGATYQYRVFVSDGDGNTAKGDTATITLPTTTSQTAYDRQVISDGASSYWPLDEPSGTVFYDNAAFNDMDATAGLTRGVPGPVSGETGSTFDGASDGTSATRTAIPAPDVFTLSAWVRTTTTTGGKIVGFGNAQTGTSTSYDRHLYLDNTGRVVFGVYNGTTSTLQSTNPINDGQWHQVVATLGPNGMALYVDGLRVGARSDVTNGQAYSGYWRIGGDQLNGWPNQPGSNFLAGSIADVAIFPTVLTGATIQNEYTVSGRTLAIPPAPTDAYGKAVYADNPDIYWRLDDTSGSIAADVSPNMSNGIYSGGVTLGVASPVSGAGHTAVTFDGQSGTIGSAQQYTDPTVYSEEAWFNTTTTNGGKIMGFGNQQSGLSSNYDRHVYMLTSGQLVFGTWTGTENLAQTTGSYNDGTWHYVVATQGPDGMKLYVDGQLAATNPQTQAQNYSGYWRVGGDSSWSGSNYFAGTIDEVAFYSTELSATQVMNHYKASPVAPNLPPSAAFTSSVNNLTASFDGSGSSDPDGTIASYSWDFGDGSAAGSGATPQHTYASGGTYHVTLTVTDNGGATGTVEHDVTVTPPPNQPPTAAFTSSANLLTASFDGSGSSDPDGTVASYSWDFGDGSAAGSGATPQHTYAAPGTYQVTLTVTDNQGATGSVTKAVTVTAVVAADAFGRTTSNGWGTADTGGPWSVTGTTSRFSVGGGVGAVNVEAAAVGPTAYLNSVSQSNFNAVVDASVSKSSGGGSYVELIGRHSGTSDYRLKVLYRADGTVQALISKVVSGTDTTLKSLVIPNLTYTPGTPLRIRFVVSGTGTTSLSGTVWPVGTTEPASPQISLTDSTAALQSAGSFGIQSYVAGTSTALPVVFTYDNLSVTTS